MSPTILHADMNACYASIEQARNPALIPQPKAVQRAFFPDYPAHEKKEDLSRALFAIRSRFGSKSVDFAALYGYDYADLDRDRADMPTNKFVACAR